MFGTHWLFSLAFLAYILLPPKVGTVVYVGTNPDTNSKTIYFGSQGLNVGAFAFRVS